MSEENNNEKSTNEIKFYTESELQEIENNQEGNQEETTNEDNVYNVDDFKNTNQNDDSESTTDQENDNVENTDNEAISETNNADNNDTSDTVDNEPFQYANDTIKQLDEWAKKNPNVDLQEALSWQSFDMENANEDDLIVEALINNNPNVSEEYIDMKMQEFEILFASEEEIKAKIEDPNDPFTKQDWTKLYLESEQLISQGKQVIEDRQKSFNVNLENPNGVSEESIRMYQEGVTNAMKDYKEELFQVGDTEIKYSVDEAIRKKVEDIMKTPETLWNKYVDEKGNVDYNTLRSDMLWLANKDQISKIILDQSKNVGKLEMIKKDKNIDFKKTTNTLTEGRTTKQALYEAWKKATQG